MITDLVIFLYCTLLIVAIFNLVSQYKRKKIINGFICFQVAFILYYILIPIMSHIIIALYPGQLTGFLFRISSADSYEVIYAFIYTLIAYMTILLIYHTRISKKLSSVEFKGKKHLNSEANCLTEPNTSDLNKKRYCIAITAGLMSLIVGIIAELTIANSLGGIFEAVSMGDKLRAFGSDNSRYIPQSRLFVMVLMVSSLASTYFYVYALRIYSRFSVKLLLLVSILASFFYLLINAGRLPVLLFALPFFIDFAFRKTKHPFILVGLFSVLALILLKPLDNIFFYLSYGYVKESSISILSLINEFSFPYLNLLNVHRINTVYGFRWGIDFVTWIINIFPTPILKIFGLTEITPGYTFITEYYMGSNALGGIPTDFITLLIRQFGFLGIVFGSPLIAILCRYMDKVIYKINSKNFLFITLRISSIMFVIVPYADLDSFVRNRYDMLMVLLFAILVSKIEDKAKVNRYSSKII